jgi:quercetin dioxygenase-like cupin family protein
MGADQMTHRSTAVGLACLAAFALAGSAAVAQQNKSTPAFKEEIANIPGKSLAAVLVEYAPGGKTPSHHHAKSAFISAYVISGAVRSQVDDGPVKTFKAGEHFTEKPGAHHVVSENASDTEPAKILAIFVVDSSETPLTVMDK